MCSFNYINTKALLLIVGYNSDCDMLDLCSVVLLSIEKGELLIELIVFLIFGRH